MQPGIERSLVENDFWASADPNSSLLDWRMPSPPHEGVFVSRAVYSGDEAITYVHRDTENGEWQFLGDGMAGEGLPVLCCLHHIVDGDRSIEALADLPAGWAAERSEVGGDWRRYERGPDPED